jgi:glycosyltransferase involved in cell wall biosynthesis
MIDKISIIISTKDRIKDIIECIESILIQTVLPNEVVIIDSSETEELKSKLDSFRNSSEIAFKYIHAEASLTKARNIGIDNSIGDIIIFLDDDVILDNDYLKEVKHVFDSDAEGRVGGVTGEIISRENENESFLRKISRFWSEVLATVFLLYRSGNGKMQPSGYATLIRSGSVNKIITNVEYVCGANMSFRRELFNEFRFDENFHGYSWGEDDDIGYRFSRKYQNVYTPFAKIVHKVSPVARGSRCAIMKMAMENHYYLFKKNLPQDLKHKFAFLWSVVGLFVREGIMMAVRGDSSGVRGLVSGMSSILNRNKRGR